MPGLALPQEPATDFQSIATNAVVSAQSLPRDTIEELSSQYGVPSELMLTRSEGIPPGVADYLGDLTVALDDVVGTIKCHVYRSHKSINI